MASTSPSVARTRFNILSIDPVGCRKPDDVDLDWNTVEVDLRYERSPESLYSGNSARGYWLHVTPMKIEQKYGASMCTVNLFTGCKIHLSSVKRRCKSNQEKALCLAKQTMPRVVKWLTSEYGITIEEKELVA